MGVNEIVIENPQSKVDSVASCSGVSESVTGVSLRIRFCRVAIGFSGCALGLLVFSYFGQYSFYAELVSNFRLQVLIAVATTGVAIGLLGGMRWWVAWVGIGFVLVLLGVGWSIFSGPARGIQPGQWTEAVRLMTFNVLGSNETPQRVVRVISENRPDVVAVIEYSSDWTQHLQPLHADYPYRLVQPRWHGFGIALFSKFPIVGSSVHQLADDRTDSPMLIATLDLGSEKVLRLAAVHLLAPMQPERMSIRNRQMKEVEHWLPPKDVPTVLVGDFNCVPWSPFMKALMRGTGLRDSRDGWGYQGSWPALFWPMLIPIDQALVSSDVAVIDRQVIADPTGSDHLPVLLEIGF